MQSTENRNSVKGCIWLIRVGLILSLLLNLLLTAAIKFGVTSRAALHGLGRSIQESVHIRPSPTSIEEKRVLSCWGDSMAAGIGAGLQEDVCTLLARRLGLTPINEAVGGETSSQTEARFKERPKGLDHGFVLIWTGRNNYTDAERVNADITKIIHALPSGTNYWILEVLNGDYPSEFRGEEGYKKLVQLNYELEAAHKNRFIRLRDNLVSLALPTDTEDRARDVVPSTLRDDHVHLNYLGYRKVTEIVAAHIITAQGR